MKSACIVEPGRIETRDTADPTPLAGELVIRVMASGVCGTDVHILRGEYVGDYPVVPGHEFAGMVEKTGVGVRRYAEGDRVAVEPNLPCNNCASCMQNRQNYCENWQALGVTRPGAMAEQVLVPESAVFDIGDLDYEAAALVEPLSCVLHGIGKVPLQPGDRVAVLGAGPIGILLLQTLLLRGAAGVSVVDRVESRRSYALECGAAEGFPSPDGLTPDAYDVVVDATGAVEIMPRAVDLARPGGTVLLFGVAPAGKRMEVEPFAIFRKGLSIHSSYTSVRNSYQAVALLQEGKVGGGGFVSHRLGLRDLEEGIELVERGQEGVRKVMVLPNGA